MPTRQQRVTGKRGNSGDQNGKEDTENETIKVILEVIKDFGPWMFAMLTKQKSWKEIKKNIGKVECFERQKLYGMDKGKRIEIQYFDR